MRFSPLLAVICLSCTQTPAAPVSAVCDEVMIRYADILNEAQNDDLFFLESPCPAYQTVEFSSYDRRWPAVPFGNEDRGNFLREFERNGQTEYVLAESTGPGVLVRLWSANPAGTLRIYLDNMEAPSIEVSMLALLTGQDQRFPPPFSALTARGANLDYPFTFNEHLMVTVDDPDGAPISGRGLYYQAFVRRYLSRVQLEPYQAPSSADLQALGIQLTTTERGVWVESSQPVDTSGSARWNPTNAVVRAFRVQFLSDVDAELLSDIDLSLLVDGELVVTAPFDVLFGYGSLVPYNTRYVAGSTQSVELRYPIPVDESFEIRISDSDQVRDVTIWTESANGASSRRFAAHYGTTELPSRPFSDITLLTRQEAGVYVGTHLSAVNNETGWWGEGDEKIYVDGESFPSWFGTGAEDYFGYAWADRTRYDHPFRAQLDVGNTDLSAPDWTGPVLLLRHHVWDRIRYRQSIRFELENWHQSDTARTSYRWLSVYYSDEVVR